MGNLSILKRKKKKKKEMAIFEEYLNTNLCIRMYLPLRTTNIGGPMWGHRRRASPLMGLKFS